MSCTSRQPTGCECPCSGGQLGAAYLRWPDGNLAVLTWRPYVKLADVQQGPLAMMRPCGKVGYTVPAVELAA